MNRVLSVAVSMVFLLLLTGCDPTTSQEYIQLDNDLKQANAVGAECRSRVEQLESTVNELQGRINNLENAPKNRFQQASSLEDSGDLRNAAVMYSEIVTGFPKDSLAPEAAARADRIEAEITSALSQVNGSVRSCLAKIEKIEDINMLPVRWTNRGKIDMNWASQQDYKKRKIEKSMQPYIKEIEKQVSVLDGDLIGDQLAANIEKCLNFQ